MDPPPSYDQSQATQFAQPPTASTGANLTVGNGIPPASRRSMEDEARPLPEGWIRQFDSKEHHQFFVDTRSEPHRSIWHHPYDDEQYLSTLSSEERERLQETARVPTREDIEIDSTDDEAPHPSGKRSEKTGAAGESSSSTPAELPPRPPASKQRGASTGKPSFGRRMKDKLTGTTHEERERMRARQAEEEQRQYEFHTAFRQAMARAMETGQPQLLAKDKDGHDIYVEPPDGPDGSYGYAGNAYGYNPYAQGPYRNTLSGSPAYSNPNARFIRPPNPYNRPGGYGYGGGYGLPLVGGLLGGALLGSLLF